MALIVSEVYVLVSTTLARLKESNAFELHNLTKCAITTILNVSHIDQVSIFDRLLP